MKELTFNELKDLKPGSRVIRIFEGKERVFTKVGTVVRNNSEWFVYLTESIGSNKCICIANDKYISEKYHNRAVYFIDDNINEEEIGLIMIAQIQSAAEREIKTIKQLLELLKKNQK